MNLLNMNRLYAPVAFIAIILGGCATTQPIPEVSQPQSSALVIDLTLKAPIGIVSNKPDQIYFARIDGEEGLLQQQIIRSNYVKDGRAYLLNARPGTYVAVGAFFSQYIQPSSATYRTYFSRELVEHTKVTVREGEFAFMGSYIVDESFGLDGADEVQNHYKNVIAPGAPTSVFITSFTRDYHYRGILRERKADDKTRNEFLQKAKGDLAGSGWVARIK
jgi:hypothetical protein